ncbi:hypothetical protein [Dyadobacter crusticola]|uniref:hypothetical protein n=1 Tax=Dyadobacter crusticola TaxID=292407 RepID=UPI00146FC586|nr:hypothetical protein [Dyadobacter crusticola]
MDISLSEITETLMKNTSSLIIVILAILIAVTQCYKDVKDQKEADEKDRQLTATHNKLEKANDEIKAANTEIRIKADSIQKLQEESGKETRKLADMQSDAIKLQLLLNEHVTGGANKPIIEIMNVGTAPYPGMSDLPNAPRYKPVDITLTNPGNVPLRELTVRISGSLGFKFIGQRGRDYAEYNSALPKVDDYITYGPITLPANKTTKIFTANYEPFTNSAKYAIDITWENGYYTMFVDLQPIDMMGNFVTPQQAPPRAHLRVKNVKYMVGHKEVDPNDYFRR